jgi:acyl-CoA dehydrogenase
MALETHRIPGTRTPSARQSDLTARARAAADVARANAAAVDAEARFPSEAFAELRKQRLLGIQVPQSLDGEGATIAEIADVCYILGQSCSSTGLIYAMHQIKMACIVRHFKNNAVHERILRRIVAEQLLMA